MDVLVGVVVLASLVAALVWIARRLRVPYPILLVLGGLGLGFVPGLPRIQLAPDLVLLLFLPPILFDAAYKTSLRELWRIRRLVSLLAFGLVLITTLAVASVTIWLAPDVPLAAAFVLGAVVSPTDSIAATAVADILGLPRWLVNVIEGESLLNDATALVAYRFGVAAAVSGSFSPGGAGVSFVVIVLGGVAIGLLVGAALNFLFAHLDDPEVGVLVTLIAPFAAYLPAEAVQVSGVLAAVTAGLWHGWRAPRVLSSETRALAAGAWETMVFAANGMVFLLIGLELPHVLQVVAGRPPLVLAGLAAGTAVTVIVVRLVWVFVAAYLTRRVLGRRDERWRPGYGREFAVLGWSGMRGAVSLATALALPLAPPFPERDLIVFLTYTTILATLVGQGLTLPLLIRALGVGGGSGAGRDLAKARRAASEAALRRLEELETEIPGHVPLIESLRAQQQHREEHYDRVLAGDDGEPDAEQREHELIRRQVLAAERAAVVDLRERGEISNADLREIERGLDLEELRGDA